MNQTVFGDLRQRALAVYRVRTHGSGYIIGIHEARGRKFAIVRGEPGTDREHVVVRDSDPRVGDHSLFELPIAQWPGKVLELATMTSSAIVSVEPERDPAAVAAVGIDGHLHAPPPSPWARPAPAPPPTASGGINDVAFKSPRPAGMPDSPAIVPGRARGTNPAADAVGPRASVAKQVVVGGPAPAPPAAELPYPQRHVKYAESCASLLRSLSRRERIWEDLAHDKALRASLREHLDDCATLLEQIRRRDR